MPKYINLITVNLIGRYIQLQYGMYTSDILTNNKLLTNNLILLTI